ncbi:hypothetical protein PCAU_5993 [Pseudomonas chlororaphis subsp. aurantiaca]|uniref:DUF3304 domain-containing protein n=1 Tax=Pseudomonas chlororaphis TaxID=587753 RepID=UPI000865375D|nr:DUF3304 domain-containing protein [Pseudomonas chlororaphis]BAV78202.1 hypothetical protein PCAU_5993 [Pseudomonas chlororaphis subsp. aurantiaca]
MFNFMREMFPVHKWLAKMKFIFSMQLQFFRKIKIFLSRLGICVGLFFVAGCQAAPEMLSTPVTGFNHTSANINRFTINRAGGPNIGPFQGGGKQVCCSAIPRIWTPDLKAVIEWEVDPSPYAYREWPERPYSDAWNKRMQEHEKKYTRHTVEVEIPQYGEEICALQVHFLPCDQVRVSTTCFTPKNPSYPDKAYFQVKEPTICPSR